MKNPPQITCWSRASVWTLVTLIVTMHKEQNPASSCCPVYLACRYKLPTSCHIIIGLSVISRSKEHWKQADSGRQSVSIKGHLLWKLQSSFWFKGQMCCWTTQWAIVLCYITAHYTKQPLFFFFFAAYRTTLKKAIKAWYSCHKVRFLVAAFAPVFHSAVSGLM